VGVSVKDFTVSSEILYNYHINLRPVMTNPFEERLNRVTERTRQEQLDKERALTEAAERLRVEREARAQRARLLAEEISQAKALLLRFDTPQLEYSGNYEYKETHTIPATDWIHWRYKGTRVTEPHKKSRGSWFNKGAEWAQETSYTFSGWEVTATGTEGNAEPYHGARGTLVVPSDNSPMHLSIQGLKNNHFSLDEAISIGKFNWSVAVNSGYGGWRPIDHEFSVDSFLENCAEKIAAYLATKQGVS